MVKQIFIGGTGRSGTTIFSKYLGDHQDICKIPKETKFLINKGGLIDIYHDLYVNFSLSRARIAISQFEKLIGNMRNRFSSPYIGYDLDTIFGSMQVNKSMNEFIESITNINYYAWEIDAGEKNHQLKYIQRLLYYYFSQSLRRLFKEKSKYFVNPKVNRGLKSIVERSNHYSSIYFKDEEEILSIIRNFVDSLFNNYSKKEGKSNWCEATPENIMHADFLHKLYNNAYFIHVVRHPVGVVQSWIQRDWGPSDIEKACKYLSQAYERMIFIDELSKKKNINLITVKLENMCDLRNRIKILKFLDVSSNTKSQELFEIDKVNYWMKTINRNDLELIQIHMKKYITYYNYETL